MSSAICFDFDQSKILSSSNGLSIYHLMPTCNEPREEVMENIVGTGDNAGVHEMGIYLYNE